MKYLIEAGPTTERGNELDAKGGPGILLQYVGERFRPEAFYVSMVERRLFMVVDVEDFSQLHELIQIFATATHDEPIITPVMLAAEAAPLIAKASENAKKAPKL